MPEREYLLDVSPILRYTRCAWAGRHWIGGKGGGILRAPLKTLGIWRKSSVGIDARILLKIHINSHF